jgi:hypothetical protein
MLRREFPSEPPSVHDATIGEAIRLKAGELRDKLAEILRKNGVQNLSGAEGFFHTHHREVMGLPPRETDWVLDRAEQDTWTAANSVMRFVAISWTRRWTSPAVTEIGRATCAGMSTSRAYRSTTSETGWAPLGTRPNLGQSRSGPPSRRRLSDQTLRRPGRPLGRNRRSFRYPTAARAWRRCMPPRSGGASGFVIRLSAAGATTPNGASTHHSPPAPTTNNSDLN